MTLAIGSACPDFGGLPGTDGKEHSLADFAVNPVLVVIVSCNHCPYVIAYEERIVHLSKTYRPKGAAFIAINANDVARYPADGLPKMIERAKDRGFDFPYVRDDSQDTARALGARFTPEVFVFDHERKLRYHGRIDDNHASAASVKSRDLENALVALLAGKTPPVHDTQPVGCSVKWK
jgi:thiol-disulfide isomerase/thioredoxin